VLLSTDGPYEQVIKIKPPMVFSKSDADALVNALRVQLEQLAASPQLLAQLAAAEDERATTHIAPVAAAYAENAARIYALAAAVAAGSSDYGASPKAVAAAAAAAAGPKQRKSLLRRVLSWASAKSGGSESSMSTASVEWEAGGAAVGGAIAAAVRA